MAGNSFGSLFRVTTWGESHGQGIGAVVDGCPPGICIDLEQLNRDMARRRPGQGGASTPRKEKDEVEILSGVFAPEEKEIYTTGTPISLLIRNRDAHSKSYDHLRDLYRPGHGDYTYQKKYGIRDHRGGGRSSARETAGRVAAGALAKQVLAAQGITVIAYTVALGGIRITSFQEEEISKNQYLAPDCEAAAKMDERVTAVRAQGDTVGGIVEVRIRGCQAGLGEPVFDKLEADLAHALMSIGAVKGIEVGAGFAVADMLGSENNDQMDRSGFLSNNAGGILAGISNGNEIILRAAIKPIPSIGKKQRTVNSRGEEVILHIGGRHDISAIPRVVPVCEAMAALTVVDHVLRQRALRP